MSLLERGMQPTDTPSEARSLRTYLTVGQLAAVLAAGIHAAVVPEHLQESLLIGGFFVVVAIGQFGLAAVLRRRPPLLLVVGAGVLPIGVQGHLVVTAQLGQVVRVSAQRRGQDGR